MCHCVATAAAAETRAAQTAGRSLREEQTGEVPAAEDCGHEESPQ